MKSFKNLVQQKVDFHSIQLKRVIIQIQNYLFKISLRVYIPAYKLLALRPNNIHLMEYLELPWLVSELPENGISNVGVQCR